MTAASGRPARALMIQGTGSDVGKSFLVAGLCRAFARRGLKVLPFKPQNMSNNAAVTADGGEIGRAQALQARAAFQAPRVDMNPILLKPASETGAQVIVQGRLHATALAGAYHALKPQLLPRVLESFRRLSAGADLVLVEGAGSAAEINLRAGDIANMGFAEAAGVPVVLAADIERGGVIASLVGTRALLSATEQALTRGYIVNRFRGDPALFTGGIAAIGERTGWSCFGVVPFLPEAGLLPAEDALGLDRWRSEQAPVTSPRGIKIAVPRLPRISNFDDLDPLRAEPDVEVEIVAPGRPLPGCDLILLPGSKAVIADLAFIRAQGWDIDIQAHARRGGWVVGLCGGYQMLGRVIRDPGGIEGPPGEASGLGLLDLDTVLRDDKTLSATSATEIASGEAVAGYEIHLGETSGPAGARPWLQLADGRKDGALSADGRVRGSYIHGLFAADGFRHAFLSRLAGRREAGPSFELRVEEALDAVARHLETHLDVEGLLAAAAPQVPA